MPAWLLAFLGLAAAVRLASVAISARNERRLKAAGAVEFGRTNTRLLTLAHIAVYLGVAVESLGRPATLDAAAALGMTLWTFGTVMLVVVIRGLGPIWTIKLILASDHKLVTNRLFRTVRHPNYFLAILPELAGLMLAAHAAMTATILAGPYALLLLIRIRQEEAVMRKRFSAY
ncbi:isoprenylcysteine carboxylmethyltransferase family protein [Caulobacter segnis]|uniref:isoprenylcysteine carboxylmethyltransferase family protein n=1 Tax=Caulobacter segnis TaxID=88688 RepID=UPI0024109F5B|nr:isoprenylcysteine carboxylmethyltransferase family protein [Caulobacter segnis]MDG2520452.1 isoprenylcysteine carboxylmethyltransferase family protein [Caulobacter segnis]